MFAPPPQPRSLRHTLTAGLIVIGFALGGAVAIYFATEGLLLLWADASEESHQAFMRPQ